MSFDVYRHGNEAAFRNVGMRLVGKRQVADALRSHSAVWVAGETSSFMESLPETPPHRALSGLLLLDAKTDYSRLALLEAYFRPVVTGAMGVKLVSSDDLANILRADHPEDYLVGGLVNHKDKRIIFYRGNLQQLIVPFKWFSAPSRSARADFSDFEITDCGQTIRLGKFEAAVDALLFEFCSDARRRMKARYIARGKGIGASIRRLRLQKGLARSAFRDVTEKTLARIERGEVSKPHRDTLALIAKRLGVKSTELAEY